MRRGLLAAAALAALSVLLVAPAPSYDPWAWLLWGREIAGGALDTREGPAFKPGPVAVCAVLAPLGGAAPVAWVWLVRTAAVVALWLAFRLGRRLGGSVLAGVMAAGGVALCGRFLAYSAAGAEPAVLLALALGGLEAWRGGRHRLALACAVGCGLVRVETWPFLLVAAAVLGRREPRRRPALAAAAVLVPAAWFVPEWVGSGDVLRSGGRARVPNPGQPALADVPALASLGDATTLLLWPLWLGVAAILGAAVTRARGAALRALLPAAAGGAWVLLVAGMAQAGFSGEARYALPGVAGLAISGAAGLALVARRAPRPALAAALAAVVVALPAAERAGALPAVRAAQAYQWRLASELADVVDAAGGRAAVLACGRPYVGPYRGPLMAYRLAVPKVAVEPDARPRPPGVVFESALTARAAPTPSGPPGARTVARSSLWRVRAACPY